MRRSERPAGTHSLYFPECGIGQQYRLVVTSLPLTLAEQRNRDYKQLRCGLGLQRQNRLGELLTK